MDSKIAFKNKTDEQGLHEDVVSHDIEFFFFGSTKSALYGI